MAMGFEAMNQLNAAVRGGGNTFSPVIAMLHCSPGRAGSGKDRKA